jgi:hypothetical protein
MLAPGKVVPPPREVHLGRARPAPYPNLQEQEQDEIAVLTQREEGIRVVAHLMTGGKG